MGILGSRRWQIILLAHPLHKPCSSGLGSKQRAEPVDSAQCSYRPDGLKAFLVGLAKYTGSFFPSIGKSNLEGITYLVSLRSLHTFSRPIQICHWNGESLHMFLCAEVRPWIPSVLLRNAEGFMDDMECGNLVNP